MPVLFASDVHLSAQRHAQVEHFLSFLAGPCRSASALYLLGDVFDEWLGDDDARAPHPQVLAALAQLTLGGVPVCVVHGNHDFLLGEEFTRVTGCKVLNQPALIEVHGTSVVVLHGDQLCTLDESYQRWRATFMDPDNQREFLQLDFAARIARAVALRHESAELKRLKPDDIMDVSESAVAQTLRACGARHMVHGHTHRPKIHHIDVDGEPAVRAVLGDWYVDDLVLRWDQLGPRLVSARELSS
jgi:UDP-2,3-diacylglucosamine hydrolase